MISTDTVIKAGGQERKQWKRHIYFCLKLCGVIFKTLYCFGYLLPWTVLLLNQACHQRFCQHTVVHDVKIRVQCFDTTQNDFAGFFTFFFFTLNQKTLA